MAVNAVANLLIKIKEEGLETVKGLKNALDEVGASAGIAAAAMLGFAAYSAKEFANAEDNQNKLNTALKNSGLNVDEVSKKYNEYAEALSKKSKADDDAIVSGIALAQSFAGNIELTDELIAATLDYAAATGTSLDQAFKKVGESIGTSKNSLAEQGIVLDKNASSTEKLEVITATLQERFAGFAESETKGLNGALNLLQKTFGNLVETVGERFAPAFESAARWLAKVLEYVADSPYLDLGIAIGVVAAGFLGAVAVAAQLVAILPAITTAVGVLSGAFTLLLSPIGLVTTALVGLVAIFTTDFMDIRTSFLAFTSVIIAALTNMSDVLNATGELFKSVFTFDVEGAKKSYEDLKNAAVGHISAVSSSYTEVFDKIKAGNKEQEVAEKKISDDKVKSNKKRLAEIEAEKKATEKMYEANEKIRKGKEEDALKERIANRQLIEQQETIAAENEKIRQKDISDYTHTLVTGGIKGVAQKATSMVADTLIPGFGAAAGAMFQMLTMDSEKFSEMLNQLFSVEFLSTIADNIVILLEKLPDLFVKLVNYIAENAPAIIQNIISALIGALPEIVSALFKLVLLFSDPRFLAGLVAAVVKAIVSGFGEIGKEALGAITKAFDDVGDFLGKIFKLPPQPGPGKVEKALGINIPFVTFAEGGIVPGKAKVSGDSLLNDNVLALMSPGEAVISRSKMKNPAIRSIVDAILSGDFSPIGYAFGGKIKIGGTLGKVLSGDLKGAVSDVANITPNQIVEEFKNLTDLWAQVPEKLYGNFFKIFEANQFAYGGMIPSYAMGGLIDNQLIRAHAGEYVVNQQSTSANQGVLQAINDSRGRAVDLGNNITVNVYGGLLGDRDSARQLAKAIDQELYYLRQGNESRSFDTSLD